jgi:p21-activated kinase 1
MAKGKKKVAIKKLSHVAEKEKLANWAEAGYLSICDHPNLLKVDCCHLMKDEMWIVTDFMEGGTLKDAVHNYAFQEGQIAYVAREVLQGLKYLHAKKLVHRDLKSANIMVSNDNNIRC